MNLWSPGRYFYQPIIACTDSIYTFVAVSKPDVLITHLFFQLTSAEWKYFIQVTLWGPKKAISVKKVGIRLPAYFLIALLGQFGGSSHPDGVGRVYRYI